MTVRDGAVHLERRGRVAYVTFDRPDARNAMTMGMYAHLANHLQELGSGPTRTSDGPGVGDLRAVVLRGAGESFVAGTDIGHFSGFASADDGIEYERAMEAVIHSLESLAVPTIAVVEGAAVGGGLILAAACDLRVCTPDARFGMPIARTVGHGLSVANHARLVAHLGPGRTKAMLLLGEFLDAGDAHAAGFVHRVIEKDGLESAVDHLCERLAAHAPLTLRVTKEAVRRVLRRAHSDQDDELLRIVYGSSDFRRGVRAFLEKEHPGWEGR